VYDIEFQAIGMKNSSHAKKFARTLVAYFRVDISDGWGREDEAKRLNFVNKNALKNFVYRIFLSIKKYSCK